MLSETEWYGIYCRIVDQYRDPDSCFLKWESVKQQLGFEIERVSDVDSLPYRRENILLTFTDPKKQAWFLLQYCNNTN